jgi:hypothetical protein
MTIHTLVEAARKIGLTTLARVIRSSRFSTSRKEDASDENDPRGTGADALARRPQLAAALAELAQAYSFPAPTPADAASSETPKVSVPAVRRATLQLADAELRYRIIRAEESLIELKSALEDMRSQRDAWQAMAQAKLVPVNGATLSWRRWLPRAG